ncbi:hypothetical protein CDAR_548891 [Caerostris darwini]|uniref:Cytochrome c biogenesis B n=1 Tax=Caerostris darwini TaxID=1538125 RepID=A0AAV4WJP6_9ARAC|nr:hypothetical protein CDAR_548891 [Caerostris darwini]
MGSIHILPSFILITPKDCRSGESQPPSLSQMKDSPTYTFISLIPMSIRVPSVQFRSSHSESDCSNPRCPPGSMISTICFSGMRRHHRILSLLAIAPFFPPLPRAE